MRPAAPLAVCLAMLLIQGCGRLGFDPRPLPPDAGQMQPDTGTDATLPPPPPMDAGEDSSLPIAEAGVDAPAEAAADSGAEDSGPEDTGCPTSPITDYCGELPQLRTDPIIDGKLDCGPMLRDFVPFGWTAGAAPLAPARVAIAWWPEGIYFYVEVDDDMILSAPDGVDPWCGDGVEVYADSDAMYAAKPFYDGMGTMQLIARPPSGDQPNSSGVRWRYEMTNNTLVGDWNVNHITVTRPGGYAFEAKVTAPDLDLPGVLVLQPGGKVGIDVGINVSVPDMNAMGPEADCPLRLGQYFMNTLDSSCTGESCLPFMSTSAFCESVLKP